MVEKKETLKKEKNQLGLTADKDDFSEWFAELMIKADLADYTDISGCIVFKPSSYVLWEKIQTELNLEFKKIGIKNSYFPLFIPEKFLSVEKDHVEGFAPEVAWVEKAGDSKLAERLAVRPTSEAIMYPSFSKWIRSWRDLPLRLNQWNNVVRWEFKHPVPFFRTREFLWNELHTVNATEQQALDEGEKVMEAYRKITEDFMALYGVYGRKTEKEKFAGAVFSEKVHYVLSNGKALEGVPFHFDGKNFAKAYNINFLDEKGKEQYPWQNTYAISTRMLGVMFAIHSDEKGLVIPPKIADKKIVIIPILFENTKKNVLQQAEKIKEELEDLGVFIDGREHLNPGFKFNEWELKGIPIRIEIGPKDLEKQEVVILRRDTLEKKSVKFSQIKKEVERLIEDIQKNLFNKSKKLWESKVKRANDLEELKELIQDKYLAIIPLSNSEEVEEELKTQTGAKTLFIDSKQKIKNEKCIVSGKKADYFVYVGKSY